MGLTVSVFHFLPDGTVKRIPYARWKRITDEGEPFIGYENQKIRIAYAYIERQNRKPIFCRYTEGVIYRVNAKGKIDRMEMLADIPSPLGDMVFDDDLVALNVIHAESKFKAKRYFARHRWALTGKDIQAILDVVFN